MKVNRYRVNYHEWGMGGESWGSTEVQALTVEQAIYLAGRKRGPLVFPVRCAEVDDVVFLGEEEEEHVK